MRLSELPWLHYLVDNHTADKTSLLCVAEAESDHSQAAFYAPLDEHGNLHAAYRFEFSLYQGKGQFATKLYSEDHTFLGVAKSAKIDRRDHLVLMLLSATGLPFETDLLVGNVQNDEVLMPLLGRTSPRKSWHYGGKLWHHDFAASLAEFQPTHVGVWDRLLLDFGISIIGCDPHRHYAERHPAQR